MDILMLGRSKVHKTQVVLAPGFISVSLCNSPTTHQVSHNHNVQNAIRAIFAKCNLCFNILAPQVQGCSQYDWIIMVVQKQQQKWPHGQYWVQFAHVT